jgi:hypothetical protein
VLTCEDFFYVEETDCLEEDIPRLFFEEEAGIAGFAMIP